MALSLRCMAQASANSILGPTSPTSRSVVSPKKGRTPKTPKTPACRSPSFFPDSEAATKLPRPRQSAVRFTEEDLSPSEKPRGSCNPSPEPTSPIQRRALHALARGVNFTLPGAFPAVLGSLFPSPVPEAEGGEPAHTKSGTSTREAKQEEGTPASEARQKTSGPVLLGSRTPNRVIQQNEASELSCAAAARQNYLMRQERILGRMMDFAV
ncbi:unnamed protein product [Effrenium voratum]|nr:unnamed protein product [Effrenium voratum]